MIQSAPSITFNPKRFDVAALHEELDAERERRGMTWQQIADEMGVSATTLRNTAKGGRMELDGVMFMLQWLGRTAEDFLRHLPPPELRK